MPERVALSPRRGVPTPGTPRWPLVCKRTWPTPVAAGGKIAPVVEALPLDRWCPICGGLYPARSDGVLGWHQTGTPTGVVECPGYGAPGTEHKPAPTPTRKAVAR